MCENLPVYIYAYHACLVPVEDAKERGILWNSMELHSGCEPLMWVLGTEPRISTRAASAFKLCAIVPGPFGGEFS